MIYTIGYSNRSLPEFLNELHGRGITQLWDVRSSPWSRNAPFNAPKIEMWAESEGIFYHRCGDVLGGRSEVPLNDPKYLDGLEQILAASSREPLAIMCAEGDPSQCHRTYDIGASLLIKLKVVVRSILRDGKEESVEKTLGRVPASWFNSEIGAALNRQVDLFPPK